VDVLSELNIKHFLWGLFYRMRQNIEGCSEGGNNKLIDMEIDMIAGENVGRLDIVFGQLLFQMALIYYLFNKNIYCCYLQSSL